MKKLLILLSVLFFLIGCSEKKPIKNPPTELPLNFENSSLRYYQKIFEKRYGSCSDNSGCASISIIYPEIINSGAGIDSINSFIKSKVLQLPLGKKKYCCVEAISDSLFSEYISLQHDFHDYKIPWKISLKIEISYLSDKIISLKNETIMFTGGANPYSQREFYNFFIKSGKRIILNSLLSDDEYQQLVEFGKDAFYSQNKLDKKRTLKDLGYWFEQDKFTLNNNFTISDSGIVFLYNLYEIAPRGFGVSKILIPKSKFSFLQNVY